MSNKNDRQKLSIISGKQAEDAYIEPIERVRKKIKASRRSWFLTAAIEKLERDGEL